MPLRHGAGGVEADAVEQFPHYVDNILAMMAPGRRRTAGAAAPSRFDATPVATSVAPVWLLGSSTTRRLRGEGLPYVFAHHFSGRGTAEALALYRDTYRPARSTLSRRPS